MPMKALKTLRYSRGLTLVELMTALVISLVLLAGVAQVFVANKQTYQFSQSFARNQENSRFAVNILVRALRNAGYMSCQPGYVQNFLVGGGTGFAWDEEQSVEGYDGSSVPSALSGKLPSGVSLVSGADAITLHAVSGTGLRLQADMSDPTDDITIPTDNGLSNGDIVMVADCEKGAIFQITSADPDSTGILSHKSGSGTPGNTSSRLNKAYGTGTELVRLTEVSYLLGNKKVDVDGDGTADDVPTLYRYRDGAANAEELVEGIEDLQLRYGIADDPNDPGTASKYLTASQVTSANEWGDVVAVEVRALVASLRGNLLDTAQDLTFNGATVDTSDKKIRQTANVIVGVRNAIR